MKKLACRFCGEKLTQTFVDLGLSPIANNYLEVKSDKKTEKFYPLHAYVCSKCLLVQLPSDHTEDEIFTDDYAYFSSYSASWLAHAKTYVGMITKKLKLGKKSFVIEIASNDGYLLQYFKEKQIPALGIEPCDSVARVAIKKGIPTLKKFFGEDLGKKLKKRGKQADLVIANNVLAHVPQLNDFVSGLKKVIKPEGVITVEFPHLLQLMRKNEFDTIYHEHYSYFSFTTVRDIFASHGLIIFDVEELNTHGGSLRIYAGHSEALRKISKRVQTLLTREKRMGLLKLATYRAFRNRVYATKLRFSKFLVQARKKGKTVVAYGAPAKGNTFINFLGIKKDLINYTVDANPHKQNHLLPGSHIPVVSPDVIFKTKPDYVVILPWNLKDEIVKQMSGVRKWGAKFIVAIPFLMIF